MILTVLNFGCEQKKSNRIGKKLLFCNAYVTSLRFLRMAMTVQELKMKSKDTEQTKKLLLREKKTK